MSENYTEKDHAWYVQGKELGSWEGAKDERAAIVKWLRWLRPNDEPDPDARYFADLIESGEHHKETTNV